LEKRRANRANGRRIGAIAGETMNKEMPEERDITTEDISKWRLQGAAEAQAFFALRERTSARLAVGQVGLRYPIRAQLRFLADHAAAKDAVESEIPLSFAQENGLRMFPSLCADREEYIRGPISGGS
jgi:ethanolamine ammonia-lyase small subunit